MKIQSKIIIFYFNRLTLIGVLFSSLITLASTNCFAWDYDNPEPRSYPPNLSMGWAWPGGKWDLFWWRFEDQELWEAEYEPRIKADITQMLDYLWATDVPSRRRAVSNLVTIPAFIQSDQRLVWTVKRFFEVAEEMDVPISIKIAGYVWWDRSKSDCPNCTHIWDRNNADWVEHVEWWGWSSDYVWAPEFKDLPYPQNEKLWRDWGGGPFILEIPHPNFDSPAFRELAGRKVGIVANEVAAQYQSLKEKNKSYLLTSFIPENEISYGLNFAVDSAPISKHGVNMYRQRNCPNDVLDCLPPKPNNVSRNDWIKQKSDEFYRPDDFWLELITAAQEYMTYIARIAHETGLPKDKIISQTILNYDLQKGNEIILDVPFQDTALNNYSIPGYSFYKNKIESNETMEALQFLKDSRSVTKYALVEYLDSGSLDAWRSNYDKFVNNPIIPQAHFINIQNWDNVILPAIQNNNANYYSGGMLINELIRNWHSSCGNYAIEFGENCDMNNLNRTTCVNLGFSGGTLSCNNSCQFNTTNCTGISTTPLPLITYDQLINLFNKYSNAPLDRNNDGITNIFDVNNWIIDL